MSILDISAVYTGILTGNIIGPKGKDHTNILKLNIIIIGTEARGDNNLNNLDNNKNYKKIKIIKFDKYYSK